MAAYALQFDKKIKPSVLSAALPDVTWNSIRTYAVNELDADERTAIFQKPRSYYGTWTVESKEQKLSPSAHIKARLLEHYQRKLSNINECMGGARFDDSNGSETDALAPVFVSWWRYFRQAQVEAMKQELEQARSGWPTFVATRKKFMDMKEVEYKDVESMDSLIPTYDSDFRVQPLAGEDRLNPEQGLTQMNIDSENFPETVNIDAEMAVPQVNDSRPLMADQDAGFVTLVSGATRWMAEWARGSIPDICGANNGWRAALVRSWDASKDGREKDPWVLRMYPPGTFDDN